MTVRAEVTLEFADGEFLFALRARQIEELQAVCKAGFATICKRVDSDDWEYGDLYHTIRLGLIGGGMGAVEAKRKCDAYVDGAPLAWGPNSPLLIAKSILGAVLMGVPESAGGKPMPGETPATTGSTSPTTAPPSSMPV